MAQAAAPATRKAAVILCGSGRADGSEITEAVSVLVHLSRLGFAAACFAPNRAQADVVDHATGAATAERRHCMTEAARISRGDIRPLDALDPREFDLLAVPGGFGAAKNLCTFAKDGAACTVDADLERAVRAFHAARKPIAMCCIAPVIVAKTLGRGAGGPGVRVTLGLAQGGGPDAVAGWGSTHEPRPATEACVDEANLVTTAPAYMHGEATPHEVFAGIGAMIEAAARLARRAG